MNKEFISQPPVGLTQPQGLERQRSSAAHAQEHFDNAVFMAGQFNQEVSLTVNKKGEARYDIIPKEATKVDPSITIIEASVVLPSSAGTTNEHKEPNKGKSIELNEALGQKRKRRQANEAIFSGIRGKTVFDNGRPVNINDHPVNPETRTKNKRNSRGRRNGSR